jgi:hypothetical protein
VVGSNLLWLGPCGVSKCWPHYVGFTWAMLGAPPGHASKCMLLHNMLACVPLSARDQ